MLTLGAVDRGVKHLSGQTKDYKIDICCFFVKHAVFRSKNRDWFMCPSEVTCLLEDCCFIELASTIKI